MKKLLSVLAFWLLTACASKVMILQCPVVSMKKNNAPKGAKFTEGKEVNVQWCGGEDPVQANDDGSKLYGMIDQAIYKAHKETKADFFMNNRFYQQSSCVIMQANVAKLSGGDSGGGEEEAAPPPDQKNKKTKGKHKKKG